MYGTHISSKEDFLNFMAIFLKDLHDNQERWPNNDLPSFLTAMRNWIENMEQYYINTSQPVPDMNWKALSDILMASRIYE